MSLTKCRICGKETEALNGLCLECEAKLWQQHKEPVEVILCEQ